MVKFYRNNWYYVGGIIFIALSYIVGIWGSEIDPVRKILVLSYMALLVHQFEEYALPGGFPAIWNIAVSGEKEIAHKYPLNKQGSLLVNTLSAYTFYISAIIFKDWYWLGILTMVFGFAQFATHGIIIPKKLKSLYDPGLGAVLCLHIPIGIYYLWYLYSNMDVPTWQWVAGVAGLPVVALLLIQLPMKITQSKENLYPWSEDEMKRFSVLEKVNSRNTSKKGGNFK
jgi:hypothetical protein